MLSENLLCKFSRLSLGRCVRAVIIAIYAPFEIIISIFGDVEEHFILKISKYKYDQRFPLEKLYTIVPLLSCISDFITIFYYETSIKVRIQTIVRGLQNTVLGYLLLSAAIVFSSARHDSGPVGVLIRNFMNNFTP